VALEVLDFPLVPFGGLPCGEGAKVASAAGLGIDLSRIKPILARLEFANHDPLPVNIGLNKIGRNRRRAVFQTSPGVGSDRMVDRPIFDRRYRWVL
jgi:hypothetical protein